MSNYTEQEVQEAVEKIVRSTVRHPTGILGDRKVEQTFNDLQEAAAGCFILYFNAPFYALFLGVKRTLDALESQAGTITSLIDAVLSTDRLTMPVADLSPLANAKSALEELEAAVSSRSEGFKDIEQVPAYRRYVQNLDSFLGATGANIRSQGSVVDTPSGARAKIPGLVRQMVEQQTELLRLVRLLSGALEDFSSLNLPRIAAQGVISRAREVLTAHYNTMSELSPEERLEDLRAVTLDLLTQKPLVAKYGAAQAPNEFISTSGLAVAFADADHPATPAVRPSDKYGPYPIIESAQFIEFTMDGGAPFNYPLPLAFVAELNGNLQEPYEIVATANSLRIGFGNVDTGLAIFNVGLTLGTRSAQQVADEVNAVLAATSLRCQRRFYPVRYEAPVTTTSLGGNNARFTIFAGDLTQLGVVVGDEVDVTDGTNTGTTWTITAVDGAGQYVNASSAAPVVPATDDIIQIGPAARALKLIDTDAVASIAQRRTIRLPADSPEPITAATLGWFPGAEMRSRPVAASAVVDNINQSTAKLKAELDFVPRYYTGGARSVPSDPTHVVLSKMEGEGLAGGGTTCVINTTYFDLEDTFGTGDKCVIRSSLTPADIGQEGEVIFMAGGTFTVQFMNAITAGDIGFEIGPDVTFGFGDVLEISDGPNQGRYVVGQDQLVGTDASFKLALEGALPVPKDGELSVEFAVEFGSERVSFQSRDVTLASSIIVNGAGAPYFLDGPSIGLVRRGFTNWLQFAEFPFGTTVGDIVQLYLNQYNVVAQSFTISALDTTLRLLQINGLASTTFSLAFDFDIPNPFGRIRIAQVANYKELKERCDTWLSRPQQQELYFRNLARLLNPILTNANPTTSMVNDAVNELKKLLVFLSEAGALMYGSSLTPTTGIEDSLEFALEGYEAPAVEPVDVLLSTFRQKGADRAIDLLLEGQFSTFFNLGVDGVSYSGTLMQSLRDMAREDLPVRKFNRADTRGEKLIGTQPDQTDFEFSSDDVDSANTPDIPMAPDAASPGENY